MAFVARPVMQGTTTNPTGFTKLVGLVATTGDPYDKVLRRDLCSCLPTFLGNESGALDAGFALLSALNAAQVTKLGDCSFPPFFNSLYNLFVPSRFGSKADMTWTDADDRSGCALSFVVDQRSHVQRSA